MATTSMPGPTRTIQGPTITTTQTNATTTPELLSALENYQGGGYIRKFGKIKRKRRK